MSNICVVECYCPICRGARFPLCKYSLELLKPGVPADGHHVIPVAAANGFVPRGAKAAAARLRASQNESEEMQEMGVNVDKYMSGDSDSVQSDYLPFLKKTDLPKDGSAASATVIELREVELEFSDLCLDVKMGKGKFSIGIKEDAVILRQLVEALGKNTDKWKGKRIALYLAKKKYINVETPTRKAGDSKGGKKGKRTRR